MSPFRIGIDGRAFSSPAGGVRRYIGELYGAMARLPDVELVAIGPRDGSTLPAGVGAVPAASLPTNLGWMAWSLPVAARRARVDVFHAPDYKAPLWGVHPQAVTIHDVSYARHPEWDAYRNDPLRRWFYRRGALAADRVITDSGFSRAEIHAAYGIPESRIDVVPLAAAACFSPGAFDPALAPAGVRQPYALHVGDLHARRNLETALQAMLGVRAEFRLTEEFRLKAETTQSLNGDGALVCAGIDRGEGDHLRARALTDPGALVLTGPVDEDALVNLYRGASMLLYPSRYEGFGLPVLEAMQCGVPVIAARAASVPEVAGDAAILLDPLDAAAWQAAIARVLGDAEYAASLRRLGLARAAEFSWDRTANETLAVLRQCVRDRRQ